MTHPGRDSLVGTVIADRYRVERLIGTGGMGSVYEVVHLRLGRRFALKRLASALVDDPEALARFRREGEIVARFRHPNIVEIVDWENLDDGTPAMVMELLQGEDLATRLRRGPFAWPAIAVIADQALAALAVAHAAGVVHRDLKPQNLFLARDDAGGERVKILDFGVSKVADAQTGLTIGDRLIGTPRYMAPEQADSQVGQVGPPADIWAMGAILFELATGHEPFPAPSTLGTLFRIRHGEPEPLLEYRPDAPPGFCDVVARALDRNPATRLASANEMRLALARALAGAPDSPVVLRQPGVSRPTVTGEDLNGPTVIAPGPSETTLGRAAGEPLAGPPRRPRRAALLAAGTATAAALAIVVVTNGTGSGGAGPGNASGGMDAGSPPARSALATAADAAPPDAAPAPDALPSDARGPRSQPTSDAPHGGTGGKRHPTRKGGGHGGGSKQLPGDRNPYDW